MNILRSLLAMLFAIAIANPACCCTLRKAEETVAASHCCGGKKEEPATPAACNCAAENPKQLEEPPTVPGPLAAALPPLLPSAVDLLLPAVPVRENSRPDFRSDTGPPRHRLALLQRFVI